MKEFNFEKELLSVQDELFRFAYKLTANREKAEDLLQDTLLKAMLHKESYNKKKWSLINLIFLYLVIIKLMLFYSHVLF